MLSKFLGVQHFAEAGSWKTGDKAGNDFVAKITPQMMSENEWRRGVALSPWLTEVTRRRNANQLHDDGHFEIVDAMPTEVGEGTKTTTAVLSYEDRRGHDEKSYSEDGHSSGKKDICWKPADCCLETVA